MNLKSIRKGAFFMPKNIYKCLKINGKCNLYIKIKFNNVKLKYYIS